MKKLKVSSTILALIISAGAHAAAVDLCPGETDQYASTKEGTNIVLSHSHQDRALALASALAVACKTFDFGNGTVGGDPIAKKWNSSTETLETYCTFDRTKDVRSSVDVKVSFSGDFARYQYPQESCSHPVKMDTELLLIQNKS
ncbi:MAG: hypothetical protein AB1540_15220 [Bdellovibrionota bacterium]